MFMNLSEMMQSKGFAPKKVSSTHGGEYHSPCPSCGGRDRFSIHLGKNRYYCRQCRCWGDAIQFLRDFEGRSYSDAAALVGRVFLSPQEVGLQKEVCFSQWSYQASHFVDSCHRVLLQNQKAMEIIFQRGINLESIKRYRLGWNSNDTWGKPTEWGFSPESKKVFLPVGIVIPILKGEEVVKLKIRRSGWHQKDQWPKYLEIRGSLQKTTLFVIEQSLPSMILESELDGILLTQLAGDLCNFIALGGASKRPDEETRAFLGKNPHLLFSLDYDDAGVAAYKWWNSQFSSLTIWVPPVEKSPGDAFLRGIDLRVWVQKGLEL